MTAFTTTESAPLFEEHVETEGAKKKLRFTAAQSCLWGAMLLSLATTAVVVADALRTERPAIAVASTVGLLLLASLPYMLTVVTALKIRRSVADGRYELVISGHVDEESRSAAKRSWDYELKRYRGSSLRSQLYAGLFGLTGSLALCTCLVLTVLGISAGGVLTQPALHACTLSVAAATATVFSIQFARCTQRIATRDDTAAMFSWATRAVIFVIIADLGFFALLYKATGTANGLGLWGAALLGVTTGILGRNALRDLQTKATEKLQIGAVQRKNDEALTRIEGVTEEDGERCAEEGVQSLPDLAFAPTGRLFFNTGYSLHKITDWQDQALLALRVGDERRVELAKQLGIRGATDLWEFAERFGIEDRFPAACAVPLGSDAIVTAAPPSTPEQSPSDPWSAMKLVLGLSEGALVSVLWSVYTDDVIKRLRVYTKSVVSA